MFFCQSLFHLLGKGQIAQTQEVHLEQTIGLNSMGIILGNQHVLPLLERDDIGQIIVAHHHTSGMDGGLPWLALDGLGQSEGLLILGLAVNNLAEGGISFIGRGQTIAEGNLFCDVGQLVLRGAESFKNVPDGLSGTKC